MSYFPYPLGNILGLEVFCHNDFYLEAGKFSITKSNKSQNINIMPVPEMAHELIFNWHTFFSQLSESSCFSDVRNSSW